MLPASECSQHKFCSWAAYLHWLPFCQILIIRRLEFDGDSDCQGIWLFFWLGHRGLTHTLLALAAVSAVTLYFLPLHTALAFIAGYSSHLLADSLTRSGVPLVWPLLDHRYGLKVLKTGGLFEGLINLVCLGVIAWMMWGYVF